MPMVVNVSYPVSHAVAINRLMDCSVAADGEEINFICFVLWDIQSIKNSLDQFQAHRVVQDLWP